MNCAEFYDAPICSYAGPRLFCFVLLSEFTVPVVAQTTAFTPAVGSGLFEIPLQPYWPGNWGGERSQLAEKGVTFGLLLYRRFASESERGNATDASRTAA
jgi:hypothetical protein